VGKVTYNFSGRDKVSERVCCPKEDAKVGSLKLLLLPAGLSALVVPVFFPAPFVHLDDEAEQSWRTVSTPAFLALGTGNVSVLYTAARIQFAFEKESTAPAGG
jgi:hypothetical protein